MAGEINNFVIGTDCVGGVCGANGGVLPGTFNVVSAVRPGMMYVLRADPKSVVAKEVNQP